MIAGTNKEWIDAIREKALSEEAAPSPAGWEAVNRRVRRSAALRRAGLASVAALPVLAMLLWAPWRGQSPSARLTAEAVIPGETLDVQGETDEALSETVDAEPVWEMEAPREILRFAQDDKESFAQDDMGSFAQDDKGSSAQEDNEVFVQEILRSAQDDMGSSAQDDMGSSAQDDGGSIAMEDWDAAPGNRPRISLGVHLGTSPVKDGTTLSLSNMQYVAALNYLNLRPESVRPNVRANSDNYRDLISSFSSSGDTPGPYILDGPSGPYSSDETPVSYIYNNAPARYSHDLPLSLALSVRMELTPRIGLESGLTYSYLHSSVHFGGNDLDQRLHFVGIPLRADVRLGTFRGFDVYGGLGGQVEKCVSASLGSVKCEERRLQWSADAFVGLQYRLGARSSLYFQPELSYYFTRTDLPTYRTENPLGINLRAGLRFDLQ